MRTSFTEDAAKAAMIVQMKSLGGEMAGIDRFVVPAWEALLRLAQNHHSEGDYELVYFWGLLGLLADIVEKNMDHGILRMD